MAPRQCLCPWPAGLSPLGVTARLSPPTAPGWPSGHMDKDQQLWPRPAKPTPSLNPKSGSSEGQPYLHHVLVDVLGVPVDQVDLLGVQVLDDDPLLAVLLCHGWGLCPGWPGQPREPLAPPAAAAPCPWHCSRLKLMSWLLRPPSSVP